jgi:hypothetical protein
LFNDLEAPELGPLDAQYSSNGRSSPSLVI